MGIKYHFSFLVFYLHNSLNKYGFGVNVTIFNDVQYRNGLDLDGIKY